MILNSDGNVELRQLNSSNKDELFELTNNNRQHLREWLPWLDDVKSSEDSEKFIQSTIDQIENNNGFHGGIWSEKKLVGCIGHHSFSQFHQSSSIGYWIAEPYEGQGIVTQATKILVDYSFSELKLNRLQIACQPQNKRSRAIPIRLGFKSEGIARQSAKLYEKFTDLEIFSLLRKEWSATS